jgi:FeS assembly SUF system regulator
MLRITKLSDYAVAILGHMASPTAPVRTARDIASETGLSAPVVSKILKSLARANLVVSHRGVQGGYQLARETSQLSVAEVIEAVEGPVALTECGENLDSCEFVGNCTVQANWLRINQVVRRALSNISVEDMILPPGTERLVQLRRTSIGGEKTTRNAPVLISENSISEVQ